MGLPFVAGSENLHSRNGPRFNHVKRSSERHRVPTDHERLHHRVNGGTTPQTSRVYSCVAEEIPEHHLFRASSCMEGMEGSEQMREPDKCARKASHDGCCGW